MDITQKCIITGKHGFDNLEANKFTIINVEAKNGDLIKINKVDGIRFNEVLAAFESPQHEEHPIVDNQNKIIVIGGEEKKSQRTICVMGK